jgi:two-component system sensor histidine kinase KdpD
VRFSPEGKGISLTAETDQNRLLVSVKDEGPGIDPEDIPFVFDKYFRGKRQKGAWTGTGMGLAIARAILKAHHGGISVRSQVGQGTAFTFWIPLSLHSLEEAESSGATTV